MFNDRGESVYYFFTNYDKLLECPECGGWIKLKKDSLVILCNRCGHIKDIRKTTGVIAWGRYGGTVYGYKLWLRVPVCSHELWVFNKEHLDYLESYINTVNRYRIPNINQSVGSRIPGWIKSHKNRIQLKKALNRLRNKLKIIGE